MKMCHKTYSWRIFEQHACQLQMSPYSYSSMSTSQHVACLCALSLTAVTSKGNSTRHQRAHALDLTLRSTRPRGLASYPTTAQCASAPHSQSMQHPAKRNLESSAGPSMLRKIPHRAAYPATWAEPGLRALAKASAFDAAACVKPRRFALSLTRLELLHARHNEAGCFGSAAAPPPPPLAAAQAAEQAAARPLLRRLRRLQLLHARAEGCRHVLLALVAGHHLRARRVNMRPPRHAPGAPARAGLYRACSVSCGRWRAPHRAHVRHVGAHDGLQERQQVQQRGVARLQLPLLQLRTRGVGLGLGLGSGALARLQLPLLQLRARGRARIGGAGGLARPGCVAALA